MQYSHFAFSIDCYKSSCVNRIRSGYTNTYYHVKRGVRMYWVYYGRLYTTKFQAGCLAKRLEHDGWMYGYNDPRAVEVYRSRKGRYGVRFIL